MKKQNILTAVYLAVWIISHLVFWIFMSPSDAIVYVLIFLYALIPLTTLVGPATATVVSFSSS